MEELTGSNKVGQTLNEALTQQRSTKLDKTTSSENYVNIKIEEMYYKVLEKIREKMKTMKTT